MSVTKNLGLYRSPDFGQLRSCNCPKSGDDEWQRGPSFLIAARAALAELGYPEVEASVWYGLLASAGTPRSLVARIHADVLKVIRDPEFRDREMLSKGYEPSGLGPDEFAALIVRETVARGVMVKISGARAE